MSARIRTLLPLLDMECILQALDNLGERYTLRGNDIIITSKKYYVEAKLSRQNDGKYVLTGDTDVLTENFQKQLVNNYKSLYDYKVRRIREELEKKEAEAQRALEEERRRIEQERIRLQQEQRRLEEEREKYVESQKKKVYEKAKAMGYSVKETIVKDKIQLVLVKRTY